MSPKIQLIERLLDRFDYSDNMKSGFAFFIGGSMLTIDTENQIEEIKAAQSQITEFDINSEFEELLQPLRDQHIKSYFEELIWRLDIEIKVREVNIPNTKKTLSEYTFKNHQKLRSDDKKIKKLFDFDDCLIAAFEGVGAELNSHNYDFLKSYKTGMCFFNLKAQIDTLATDHMIKVIRSTLTPLLSRILSTARVTANINEGFTDIQLALSGLIDPLDIEYAETVWSFQSYVFFDNQKEINGVSDLSVDQFINHCNSRAEIFLEHNNEAIRPLAHKLIHMRMFPTLEQENKKVTAVKDAIENSFGFPSIDSKHKEINLKAIIVLAYFNVICETLLASSENITHQ